MTIRLTREQIDKALPKVEKGLELYLRLQKKIADQDAFYQDVEFRREYNHFYRVRRNSDWQEKYYGLMARAKKEKLKFHVILKQLHDKTNRYEASYTSKLIASFNTSAPVIDSIVLKNLCLRLPYATTSDRCRKIDALYRRLILLFKDFLSAENGKYLVAQFKRMYPNANITDVKMLDLVLWQSRD